MLGVGSSLRLTILHSLQILTRFARWLVDTSTEPSHAKTNYGYCR
jgi:hypothetical protein